jgi:hypothetical protein
MRSLLTGLVLILITGCSSNNSSNGTGGAAGSSSGGSSSGGSSSGGSSGSGGSTSGGCAQLCTHTDTASPSEVDCVSSESYLKGYDWPNDPVCSTIETEAQCNTCTVNVAMTDADCAAVESTCFGGSGTGGSGTGGSGTGGVGGSGTGGIGGIGGIGGVGGGNTGGVGGGSGSGCAEFCQNAPSATSAQEQCVQQESYLMGYDWSQHPVCLAADTVPGCNACVAALGMPDSACAQLESMCF